MAAAGSSANSFSTENPGPPAAPDNINRLYPSVNEAQTPIPRSWSDKDKSNFIALSHNNLRVIYKGLGKSHKDAASVRATHHIPPSCGIYYFEVKIISKGRDGFMGIGLSEIGVNLNRLPGWEKQSYGYHGDDGHSFCSSGTGQEYGPTFTTNDVIGCCVNLIERTCFYTKNGITLGTAFTDLPSILYPTVGLQTPNEVVEANFGQLPFVYDIEDYIREWHRKTKLTIERFPFSDKKGEYQNAIALQSIVSTYLVHHGYCSTAEAFAKSTNQEIDEELTSIKNRQRIQRLVLAGRMSEAIDTTHELYPGLLDNNLDLLFKLKVRQFIEMVNGSDSEMKGLSIPHPSLNRHSSTSANNRHFSHSPNHSPSTPASHKSPSLSPSHGATAGHHSRSGVITHTNSCTKGGATAKPTTTGGGGDNPTSGGGGAAPSASARRLSQDQQNGSGPSTNEQEMNATNSSMNGVSVTVPLIQSVPVHSPHEAAGDGSHSSRVGDHTSGLSHDDVMCDVISSDVDMRDDDDDSGDISSHHHHSSDSDRIISNGDNSTTAANSGKSAGVVMNGTTAMTTNGTNGVCHNGVADHNDIDMDCDGDEADEMLERETKDRIREREEKIINYGRELMKLSKEVKRKCGKSEANKKALNDAYSLMAYKDHWSSPKGHLLNPVEREPICAALNSAILDSHNLPKQPPLELVISHTAELLSTMAKHGVASCAFTSLDQYIT